MTSARIKTISLPKRSLTRSEIERAVGEELKTLDWPLKELRDRGALDVRGYTNFVKAVLRYNAYISDRG